MLHNFLVIKPNDEMSSINSYKMISISTTILAQMWA